MSAGAAEGLARDACHERVTCESLQGARIKQSVGGRAPAAGGGGRGGAEGFRSRGAFPCYPCH